MAPPLAAIIIRPKRAQDRRFLPEYLRNVGVFLLLLHCPKFQRVATVESAPPSARGRATPARHCGSGAHPTPLSRYVCALMRSRGMGAGEGVCILPFGH